jgi:hypothetical protein
MESFHIDKLANSGVPLDIDGNTYYASQITLRDQGRLQSVIRKIQPPPPKESDVKRDLAGLPPETITELVRDARKAAQFWPSPITSQEGLNILLGNEEGQKELIKSSLGKKQSLTDSDIDALMDVMTYPMFMRLAAIAISGDDPDTAPKD